MHGNYGVIPIKLLRAVLPIAVVVGIVGLALPVVTPLGVTINTRASLDPDRIIYPTAVRVVEAGHGIVSGFLS